MSSPKDELLVVVTDLAEAAFRVHAMASDNFIAEIVEMLFGRQASGIEWAWTAYEKGVPFENGKGTNVE